MTVVEAIQVVAAAVGWFGFAYKLRDLIRQPDNPGLRPLCVGLGAAALAFTVQIKQVYAPLEQHTSAGLGAVLGNCLSLIACVALQSLFLRLSSASDQVGGKVRMRSTLTGAVVVAMLVLFVIAPSNQAAMDATRDSAHQIPLISAHTYLFLAALLPAMSWLGASAWQYSVVSQRYSLRYGLRIVTAGSVFGILYGATKLTYMLGYQFDFRVPGPYGETGATLAAAAGVLSLFGLTMPAWGRLVGIDALGGWIELNRSYARLRLLWAELHAAVPGVALVRPGAGLSARFRWRGVGFARYRRVIEIWDARLQLRPYFDEAAAGRAREAGVAAGLSGESLEALAEAARLAGAVRRKASGERTAVSATPAHTATRTDVDADVRWLEQVARARRSPVLARVLPNAD